MIRQRHQKGRPRTFDEEKILARALAVFWAKGFDATTYDALEEATGLRRQSLVYAFGDKRALFAAVLRCYRDTAVRDVLAALAEAPSGRQGVEAAFALWTRDAAAEPCRGCLLVTSAGEFAGADKDVARTVIASRKALVKGFEAAFTRAAAEGDLKEGCEPRALAALAVAVGDGGLLHARNAHSGTFAEAAYAAFLTTVFD